MPLSITPNDIVWTKNGDPVRIDKANVRDGKISIDSNFDKVQKTAEYGIKNGLNTEEKEAYKTVLSKVANENKQVAISQLHSKINELKHENTNPNLVRYLENELQYLMVRDKFVPKEYASDPLDLGT